MAQSIGSAISLVMLQIFYGVYTSWSKKKVPGDLCFPMGGSDHWPFGNANVPWVFFNTAMTEDYHQPSDEVDRCSFELMQSIGQLCYLTAAQLAGI